MKCPKCEKEGKKSKVFDLGTSVTLMDTERFWDEEGRHHFHDPNKRRGCFGCSEGHQWAVTYGNPCPSCDFGREQESLDAIGDD